MIKWSVSDISLFFEIILIVRFRKHDHYPLDESILRFFVSYYFLFLNVHKAWYVPRREKTCLRPACASAQSDQRLRYSLIGKSHT